MTRWRPQVRPLHRPLELTIRKGHPIGDGTRLESGRAMSLAGSTPAPSAPARAGGFDHPFDGVRGVTAAREPVELEATGSTPAGHPHCDLGGGDDDPQRTGAPDAGPEPELAAGPRHDRGPGAGHALERDGEGRRAGRVPALRLGRLVGARARGRRARACGRHAGSFRAPEVICLAHYDRLPARR